MNTRLSASSRGRSSNYQRLVEGGTRPELARVSVARKLAAAALAVWQRKEEYDPKKFLANA